MRFALSKPGAILLTVVAFTAWCAMRTAARAQQFEWERASPVSQSMDESKLRQAREYALTGGGSGYIIRGGKLVMSWGDPKKRYDLKSTTKSIGVTALEDKIAQRSAVEVLGAIYETGFKGFSYGFRPGRSAHNALDALAVGIRCRKVNWVLDADIRGFLETSS